MSDAPQQPASTLTDDERKVLRSAALRAGATCPPFKAEWQDCCLTT